MNIAVGADADELLDGVRVCAGMHVCSIWL